MAEKTLTRKEPDKPAAPDSQARSEAWTAFRRQSG